MPRTLRLLTALLAGFAVLPALAQTPSTQPGASRSPRAPSVSTPQTPAPPATPAARGPASPTATTPPAATPSAATPAPAPAAPSPRSAAAPAPQPGGGKIDINSATAQQLDTLPGVGPVLAQQIIAGRPWDDLNDLVKKKALPQGVFDRNKDRFALANVNTSSAADLAKTLPGIGEVRSRAIVNGRPYASPQDLVTKKVLTQNQFDKIKDVIAY